MEHNSSGPDFPFIYPLKWNAVGCMNHAFGPLNVKISIQKRGWLVIKFVKPPERGPAFCLLFSVWQTWKLNYPQMHGFWRTNDGVVEVLVLHFGPFFAVTQRGPPSRKTTMTCSGRTRSSLTLCSTTRETRRRRPTSLCKTWPPS